MACQTYIDFSRASTSLWRRWARLRASHEMSVPNLDTLLLLLVKDQPRQHRVSTANLSWGKCVLRGAVCRLAPRRLPQQHAISVQPQSWIYLWHVTAHISLHPWWEAATKGQLILKTSSTPFPSLLPITRDCRVPNWCFQFIVINCS